VTSYTRAELLVLAQEWRDELERLPLSDPRCAAFALGAEKAERMAREAAPAACQVSERLPGATTLH